MSNFKVYNSENNITSKEKSAIIDFLYTHLDEFGDEKEDIEKSVDYALRTPTSAIGKNSFGGFIVTDTRDDQIVSAVVINKTGMTGYIPENILVYVATHSDYRGQGVGKAIMKKALGLADGHVALHVEPNNPAKFLYEKLGFTNKYLEMRYQND